MTQGGLDNQEYPFDSGQKAFRHVKLYYFCSCEFLRNSRKDDGQTAGADRCRPRRGHRGRLAHSPRPHEPADRPKPHDSGTPGRWERIGVHFESRVRRLSLERLCWPWYARIAPASWLMAYGVSSGRKAVNFSDWASYRPEQQRALLSASCKDASTGKMPGVYTLLRPETELSASDIETICAAARQATQGASR